MADQEGVDKGARNLIDFASWSDWKRRVSTWAAALALLVTLGAAESAHAGSGGVGPGGGGGGGGDRDRRGGGDGCRTAKLGDRTLERGDCGGDVLTLNWILKAKSFSVSLDKEFDGRTHDSVKDFQRKRDLSATGIVNDRTRGEIVSSMNNPLVSWYGPGFFGNQTACGQTLRKGTVGVAHRNLPCGTKVVFAYQGRFLRTRVIDRGPYVKRNYTRDWDLTAAAADKLRFEGTDRVRSAVID